MLANVAVLALAVVLATVVGVAVRRSRGHFRGAAATGSDEKSVDGHATGDDRLRVSRTDLGGQLGERATLLQFSSAFCAPCRATRRILTDVADLVPGVRHVDMDAESHLELVRRLGVRRTPTTFVLDAAGGVVTRSVGAPTKGAVIAALGTAVDDDGATASGRVTE